MLPLFLFIALQQDDLDSHNARVLGGGVMIELAGWRLANRSEPVWRTPMSMNIEHTKMSCFAMTGWKCIQR